MVDSRQAVERAQAFRDYVISKSTSGYPVSAQVADDVLALAAALADTERERDAVRSAATHRTEAAEARVAELETALRKCEKYLSDSCGRIGPWGYHFGHAPLEAARKALAAHPSGCAKPGGEQ